MVWRPSDRHETRQQVRPREAERASGRLQAEIDEGDAHGRGGAESSDILRRATQAEPLARATFFHANNVAFRREIFAAHGFPDMPIYRGQCTLLGDAIAAAQVGLFRSRDARAAHPYPATPAYFIARALHAGRDWVMVQSARAQDGHVRLRAVLTDYRQRLRDARQRIGLGRAAVKVGPVGAAAAMGVAFVYLSLQAAGGALTLARPNLLPRLIPI